MRSLIFILPVAALSACVSPAPQNESIAVAAAPFTAPMDPGLISCRDLANPNALAAATEWTMGRARAAALSGRLAAVPDAASVSTSLAAYCRTNSGARLRAAAAQIGV